MNWVLVGILLLANSHSIDPTFKLYRHWEYKDHNACNVFRTEYKKNLINGLKRKYPNAKIVRVACMPKTEAQRILDYLQHDFQY